MRILKAIFIFVLIDFSFILSFSNNIDRTIAHGLTSFRTNTVRQRSCVCVIDDSSCSCCENVTIFYTGDEKRLCFNMVYQTNGLIFDLTLDSLIIKSVSVANYRPFEMCSSIPGVLFSTVCVNIFDLRRSERLITVCPRMTVMSKKENWQITYTCANLSNPANLPPASLISSNNPLQANSALMPPPPPPPSENLTPPNADDCEDGDCDDEMAVAEEVGNNNGANNADNGLKNGNEADSLMMMMPSALVSVAIGPGTMTRTIPGRKPTQAISFSTTNQSVGGARRKRFNYTNSAVATVVVQMPGSPMMTIIPGMPRPGPQMPPNTMSTGQITTSVNLGGQRHPSVVKPTPAAPRVTTTLKPGGPIMTLIGQTMPRPVRPYSLDAKPFFPNTSKLKVIKKKSTAGSTTDEGKSSLSGERRNVSNWNSVSYSETPNSSNDPKRFKRQTDWFDVLHQTNRCERAYKICITRSKHYVISNFKNPRLDQSIQNSNCFNNRPNKIVNGFDNKLCTYPTIANLPVNSVKPVFITTPRPSIDSVSINSSVSDALDSIIVQDESIENSDYFSQNGPFILPRPNTINQFPDRIPPLVALEMFRNPNKTFSNNDSSEDSVTNASV